MLKDWRISTVTVVFLLGATLPSKALAQSAPFPSPQPTYSNPTNLPGLPEYTLGPGDRIRVDIFQVEEYSREYLVSIDGTVSLPLIGRIKAQGLTLTELGERLSERYSAFLRRPLITVSMLAPRPLKIAVAGEVNRPGSYEVRLDSQQAFPSVTDLIQQAGGITASADIRQIQVRRFVNGAERLYTVDLSRLLQQGDLKQDFTLLDGDSVVVLAKAIDPSEGRLLAEANFGLQANQPVSVAIVGEVYRPGSYKIIPQERVNNNINVNNTSVAVREVPQPPRITQALDQAGGIKPLADVRNIEVRRSTRFGEEQTITVDLWNLLQTGDLSEDIILQEGDTIVVPTAEAIDPTEYDTLATASFAPDNIRVNVVGEVNTPGTIQIPPNTPLNQAILAAGGFNFRRANTEVVELIRLEPNGTVSKREINVNFSEGIGEDNNPIVRNNDVIFVRRSGITAFTDGFGTSVTPIFGVLLPVLNLINDFRQ